MKFIIAVGLLLVGVVAAQQVDPNRPLAELLVKRAEALIASTKAHVEELKKLDKGHLLETVQHQLTQVESIEKDLKAQLASKDIVHVLHKINVDEEELFHLENRISEELSVLQNVKDTHTPKGSDVTTLVKQAEALVAKAKESVTKHAGAKENQAIQAEEAQIETLIKAILAKPSAADLKKDEEQLAKHEKTLTQLLEKAASRVPTKPATPTTH